MPAFISQSSLLGKAARSVCILIQFRRSLVDECDPVGSPGLWNQFETIDPLLDIIEARRKEVIYHVAMNLRNFLLTGTAATGIECQLH